jgi:membrane protease YdiL (CAAX protease family)
MMNHWLVRILVFVVAICAPFAAIFAVEFEPEDALSVQALMYGVACIAVVAIEHGRRGSTMIASGLLPTPWSPRLVLYGVLWAALAASVVLSAALLAGGTMEALAAPSVTVHGLTSIALFAIGEEVVFRGTILEALNERFGSVVSVSITSALFAAAHAGNPGASIISTVNVGLAGMALGWMVLTTSSLWTAIGFHVVWNLLLAAVFGVVSGMDLGVGIVKLNSDAISSELRPWITGTFGVEEGYVTTIVLTLSVVFLTRVIPYDPYVRAARLRRAFSS